MQANCYPEGSFFLPPSPPLVQRPGGFREAFKSAVLRRKSSKASLVVERPLPSLPPMPAPFLVGDLEPVPAHIDELHRLKALKSFGRVVQAGERARSELDAWQADRASEAGHVVTYEQGLERLRLQQQQASRSASSLSSYLAQPSSATSSTFAFDSSSSNIRSSSDAERASKVARVRQFIPDYPDHAPSTFFSKLDPTFNDDRKTMKSTASSWDLRAAAAIDRSAASVPLPLQATAIAAPRGAPSPSPTPSRREEVGIACSPSMAQHPRDSHLPSLSPDSSPSPSPLSQYFPTARRHGYVPPSSSSSSGFSIHRPSFSSSSSSSSTSTSSSRLPTPLESPTRAHFAFPPKDTAPSWKYQTTLPLSVSSVSSCSTSSSASSAGYAFPRRPTIDDLAKLSSLHGPSPLDKIISDMMAEMGADDVPVDFDHSRAGSEEGSSRGSCWHATDYLNHNDDDEGSVIRF